MSETVTASLGRIWADANYFKWPETLVPWHQIPARDQNVIEYGMCAVREAVIAMDTGQKSRIVRNLFGAKVVEVPLPGDMGVCWERDKLREFSKQKIKQTELLDQKIAVQKQELSEQWDKIQYLQGRMQEAQGHILFGHQEVIIDALRKRLTEHAIDHSDIK